jgi:hypothetical protein
MCLLPNSHYEQVMTAFGGKGYFVQTPEELQKSLRQTLEDTATPSLINIMIEPQSSRKAQVNILAKKKASVPSPFCSRRKHPQLLMVLSKPFLNWAVSYSVTIWLRYC